MPIVKYSSLVLLQFISYCLCAQNSDKIILENAFDNHPEMLSEERFDKTDDNIVEVATAQPMNTAAPSTKAKSDEKEGRLEWSIGFGVGYSTHAASYSIDYRFRKKEFSGFRSIVLDTKIGWRLYESLVIFGTWKYAPGNSIISPYRSNYLGGGIAYYFGDWQHFSIHGGLGKYQTKVGRNELFGNGLLVNYGTTIKLTDSFGFELNVLHGKIKPDTTNSNILDSMEFNFTTGVVLVF